MNRRDVLTIALLLSLNVILIGLVVMASEHVTNGNFSAGFAYWQLPLPPGTLVRVSSTKAGSVVRINA